MHRSEPRRPDNRISLDWLRGILAWEREQGPDDRELDRCPRKLVTAVAAATALFTHSDADGSNVFPGSRSASAKVGIAKDAITAFRRRWVRAGWLVQEGMHRSGTPIFRLALPDAQVGRSARTNGGNETRRGW